MSRHSAIRKHRRTMLRLLGAGAAMLFSVGIFVPHAMAQAAHRPSRPAFARPAMVYPRRSAPARVAPAQAPVGHTQAPIVRAAPESLAERSQEPTMLAAQSEQRQPQPRTAPAPAPALVNPAHPNQSQQHLGAWMESHRNMPLAEQQRALEGEPGFRNLPSQEQQRLHNQLTQLNSMPAEQRQRLLNRNEQMERLAPPQRQQVRNAMAQVGNLPEDRRHAVVRTFYQLRDMPPAQRQAYLNSPQFRNQFSDQERSTLTSLFATAPFFRF